MSRDVKQFSRWTAKPHPQGPTATAVVVVIRWNAWHYYSFIYTPIYVMSQVLQKNYQKFDFYNT